MGLHVALIEPKIPPNTGNIARLCAATGTSLHLIEPLGFSLDDHDVKRAGLDYWDSVDYWVHPTWRHFREVVAPERCLYFSSHGERPFWDAPFADRVLVAPPGHQQVVVQRIQHVVPEHRAGDLGQGGLDGYQRQPRRAGHRGLVARRIGRRMQVAVAGAVLAAGAHSAHGRPSSSA